MSLPDDLRELLEAGAHFGHQARRWNPKMAPYIYAARDGVHIFDLTITAKLLNQACDFIKAQAAAGKSIVFVGTKRQAKAIVLEEAQRVGAPYVVERWMGGTITNWEELSKRINKLKEMKQKWQTGGYDKYTKKERVLINREMSRLDRFFGGIAELNSKPDILFVVDIAKEDVVIKEAKTRQIPVVAMVDSNSNPDMVDLVIPANDDAVRSIKYVVSRIADAYAQGRAAKKDEPKEVLSGNTKPVTKINLAAEPKLVTKVNVAKEAVKTVSKTPVVTKPVALVTTPKVTVAAKPEAKKPVAKAKKPVATTKPKAAPKKQVKPAAKAKKPAVKKTVKTKSKNK